MADQDQEPEPPPRHTYQSSTISQFFARVRRECELMQLADHQQRQHQQYRQQQQQQQQQLYGAARHGRVDEVRRLLDQGASLDELCVSAAPAAAGGACTDALCWGAPLASRTGGRR